MQLEFQELALIAERMEQGVVVCNNEGNIEYTNPFVSRFFAFNEGELLGKNVQDLSPNFTFNPKKMQQTKVLLPAISLKNKFGNTIHFNATIIRAASEKRIIVMIEDVTSIIDANIGLINKINTIEKLTKSRFIRDGQLTKAIQEILFESAHALNVERVNAWIVDKDFTMIESIGNYTKSTNSFEDKTILLRKDMPAYFKLLATQEIIATNYSLEDPRTEELVAPYLSLYGITSMIDIPIRVGGEMIGVVCFEHLGAPRKWDLTERKFGFFVAQLIAQSLQSNENQKYKQHLEVLLKEKEDLLKELGKKN